MAQTGYTPILIYSSSTTTNAPSAGNLTNSTLGSELAINITDGKLFYKDNANAVQVIAWKTTPTTAGGTGLTSYTAGDLLYYSSGTTLTKLGIGSAYQALQVNAGGTAPSWQASATSTLTAQGDLLYASAANTLARLAKNTSATRYLSNTGSSNNPAWAQVDLTNGVTGVLPNANTTGATAATANTLLLRDGSGNGTVATLNCSFISNSGNYQQAYGKELDSTTSGGSTSHMMSYQTWAGTANILVVGNTFGDVVFGTGGGTLTEKGRLITSGYLKISDTGTYANSTGTFNEFYQSADNHALIVKSVNATQSADVLVVQGDRNTTNNSYYVIQYYNTGGAVTRFRVADSGNVTNTNGSYGTISDVKIKQDIIDAPSQWDDIKNLRLRKYRLKSEASNNPDAPMYLGLVAQEAEAVSPGLIEQHQDKDADNNNLGTVTKSIKTSILYMKAVKALQEAMARIELLETQVQELKGK